MGTLHFREGAIGSDSRTAYGKRIGPSVFFVFPMSQIAQIIRVVLGTITQRRDTDTR